MTWSPAWSCPAGRSNASGRRLRVPRCNSSFHPPLRVGSAWWSMAPDCPCPRWPRRSWPTSPSNSGPSRGAPFAGALWPRSSRQRAHGALRTTMYRAKGIDRALLVGFEEVALAPGVSVDTQLCLRASGQLDWATRRALIQRVPGAMAVEGASPRVSVRSHHVLASCSASEPPRHGYLLAFPPEVIAHLKIAERVVAIGSGAPAARCMHWHVAGEPQGLVWLQPERSRDWAGCRARLLGKIPSTRARRLISLFTRSSRFVTKILGPSPSAVRSSGTLRPACPAVSGRRGGLRVRLGEDGAEHRSSRVLVRLGTRTSRLRANWTRQR